MGSRMPICSGVGCLRSNRSGQCACRHLNAGLSSFGGWGGWGGLGDFGLVAVQVCGVGGSCAGAGSGSVTGGVFLRLSTARGLVSFMELFPLRIR